MERCDPPSLKILHTPCDDCPFKGRFGGGNPDAGLRPGRLKDIIDETTSGEGSYFTCHKTVYENRYDTDAVFGDAAVCAGWLEAVERLRRVPAIIQIAERLKLVKFI